MRRLALTLTTLAILAFPAGAGAAIIYPDAQGCTLILRATSGYAICGNTTCATVNNRTNGAAWRDSQNRVHRARYADMGELRFDRPVPRSVKLAAAKLRHGTPGPKIARACA